MIRYIGYACINENLKPKTFKSCRLASIEKHGIEYLVTRIHHNLDFLAEILEWNERHGLKFYRVSSDIMPLVTHRLLLKNYSWRWYEDESILEKLNKIKSRVEKYQHRLSMHPDQFTVLNSLKPLVVEKSIEYLEYHKMLMAAIGGSDIIIHVGGVYGDKKTSIKRFVDVYNNLNKDIKEYIRVENDDKSYTVHDVLYIHKLTNCTVLFDIHHHNCNHNHDITHINISDIIKSWTNKIPKVHLSTGKKGPLDRSHKDFIRVSDYKHLESLFIGYTIDIMIEAKQKDVAVLKLMEDLDETLSTTDTSK